MKKTIASLESEICRLQEQLDKKTREVDDLKNVLPRYEEKLSYKYGNTLPDRLNHCLSQFETLARTSILKSKDFIDDVKTQFKALEIVVEGISSDSYNHTQKRVIANHVINLLRGMVQRINEIDFDYSDRIYDRYDYFRSQSPERTLYAKYKELKYELEQLKKQPVTDLLNSGEERIPF